MYLKTLWNEQAGMLMAAASPGSALAFSLGRAAFPATEPKMMRRTIATDSASQESQPAPSQSKSNEPAVAADRQEPKKSWLRRMFERHELRSWQREMRRREAYLAQARDLYDLEYRMRELDGGDVLSRGHALR